jgi:tRNA 2-thiouridine synthesizing protein A
MSTTATVLSDADLAALTPATVIDARGAACPGPLLEAKKGMGTVPVGAIIEIMSSDPATKSDIGAWASKVGHEYLGALAASGYDRVFVRRAK